MMCCCCRGCGIWPVSSAIRGGAVSTAAEVAVDPSWEPLPHEVVLPVLDSLVLYVHGEWCL
jgi:hypothetical protein